ncbi:MAG TPA: hypothetical protein DEF16_01525 [Gemmobacter sp.]|nr:hypothetical protein [Gemmobacter sp.]
MAADADLNPKASDEGFYDDLLMAEAKAALDHLASIGVAIDSAELPAPLQQAVFLLVAHLFQSRKSGAGEEARLPASFYRLIAPYREIAL